MRTWCRALAIGVVCGALGAPLAQAENWTPGGATPGQWMFGGRVGPSTLTQQLSSNINTATGPALNFQSMYAVTNMVMVGLMLEWERRGVDREVPYLDLGSMDTVSLLPTVEVRPGHFGSLFPYGSMGLGVNINSFSEHRGLGASRISPSNNFAFRLAAGADYFITKTIALNSELAWKRNDGHMHISGPGIGGLNPRDWNASSFNFLIGVRWFY
jgi:opacity protein-like surface antigen